MPYGHESCLCSTRIQRRDRTSYLHTISRQAIGNRTRDFPSHTDVRPSNQLRYMPYTEIISYPLIPVNQFLADVAQIWIDSEALGYSWPQDMQRFIPGDAFLMAYNARSVAFIMSMSSFWLLDIRVSCSMLFMKNLCSRSRRLRKFRKQSMREINLGILNSSDVIMYHLSLILTS